MIRRWLLTVLLTLGAQASLAHAEEARRGLDLYFIDVEGGAATLIVTPAGESVLIDCGDKGARDAGRIHAVATGPAGLKAIDHLIVTHWHSDHYGGVPHLSRLMPVRHFYDRGLPAAGLPKTEDPNYPLLIQAYKEATRGRSQALRPGDQVPLKQPPSGPALRVLCVCGGGEFLPERADAADNPVAKAHKPQPDDPTDNAKSLGFLLSFGPFRFLDLGDLTWNMEYRLVHPTDKIGPVDVYQVTHHGLAISNNPVLIDTVRPRVAVCNNGPRKGGHPRVIAALRRSPDIQGIYQLHRNVLAGAQDNTDPDFIANADEHCRGDFIKLAVAPDGKGYAVTVGGKGRPRRYATRAGR
jgi:beta-lactamase superfamily II metal-dependent hydrolase